MRYIFLVRFYSNQLGHSNKCLAITHRLGSSPRDVVDSAWSVVGRPRYYAELVVHNEDVPEFPADFPDYLPIEHLAGLVCRIEICTVGRVATKKEEGES